MAKKQQSREVEECKECYIEILNTGRFLQAATEADALMSLASGSSPSEVPPTHILIRADYCPQSVPVPLEGSVPRLAAPPVSSRGLSEVTDVECDETF